MKDAIRKKLNSSGGASILMALLLLLVAVMVSAVILAAAISAAKTIRTDREQQQTYLTVSSAAGLVRDSILNGSGGFESVEKTVKTEKKSRSVSRGRWGMNVGDWSVNSSSTSSAEFSSNLASGNFSALMNAAIQNAMQNSVSYSSRLTIQSEDGQYDTVSADFLLQKEQSASGANIYVLTVTFTGGEGDHLCKMKLTMQGSEKAVTSSSTSEEYSNYYQQRWYGESYPQNMTETTTSIVTTSIDWTQDKATITRERVVEE